MANTIISQRTYTSTTVTELHMVWNGHHYILNRIRPAGGKAQFLTAERAAEIIRLNQNEPGVEVSTRGHVQIGSPWEWSWMAKITTTCELVL